MLYHLAFAEYKTSGEVDPLINFINNCNDEQWLEMAYNEVVRYYQKKSDQSSFSNLWIRNTAPSAINFGDEFLCLVHFPE